MKGQSGRHPNQVANRRNPIHGLVQDIRLDPIIIPKGMTIKELLTFYMGKNTPERQNFIIDNLYVEKDLTELKEA